MCNHWLNWTLFWISASVFLPCYTGISDAGETPDCPNRGATWGVFFQANKLTSSSGQVYQRVLIEHKNHLVEVLILNRVGAILFGSRSSTASELLLELTLMRKTSGDLTCCLFSNYIIFCALSLKGNAAVLKILHEVSSWLRECVPHLRHTTLVHVYEEVTFRRSENLRETLLLLVPKHLDGNIKEKAKTFKSHLNLVQGNLLCCEQVGPDDFQRSFPTLVILLFCDVHMQMDYIPYHARPGKYLHC